MIQSVVNALEPGESNSKRPIIALDGDGVLLDYDTAYARVWERALGEKVHLHNVRAYWPTDRWGVRRLSQREQHVLRSHMDETFWSTIPAVAGAVEACKQLSSMGYELVCVSAITSRYQEARLRNLKDLGFGIEQVVATGSDAYLESPKARFLHLLAPVAFVDDYAPYFKGVSASIHKALIDRDPDGSPNVGDVVKTADSVHGSLGAFVRYWADRGEP